METISKTKQQLFLEIEALQTRLDATERRLREADEILRAQIAERKRAEETFEKAQKYTEHIEGEDGAAAILGLHPSTLRAWIHKLWIVRPETKEPD